ncbi:ArdC-like ssDNA-binding domain-containing protein [Promicromonospora soli]
MREDTRTLEEKIADRNAKIDALHEKLTDAVGQLVTGDDWRRAIEFAAKFRARSFNNTLLIWMQNYAAYEAGLVPDPFPQCVAGFQQWKQLGRSVNAGAKGFQIFAPVSARVAVAEDGSYRRLAKGEGPDPGEVVKSRMVGVRPTYVWPLALTSGKDIPETPAPKLLTGEAPAGLWTGLAVQVRERGYTLRYAPNADALGGANAMVRYDRMEVFVRLDMEPAQRAKSLCHELGHIVAGHDPQEQDVRLHRGVVEVEAESIALMVAAAHGLPTDDYTIPYVSTWASRVEGQDPVVTVQQTAARVRTAALEILAGLDTHKAPDGDPPGLSRSAGLGTAPPETEPSQGSTAGAPDDGLSLDQQGRRHARSATAVNDGMRP